MIPQRQEHTVHRNRHCETAGADIIMVYNIFTDIPLVKEIILQHRTPQNKSYRSSFILSSNMSASFRQS